MPALPHRAVPLGLALAAGAAWLATRRLEVWTDDGPGPGLMPKAAVCLMGCLALALVVAPGKTEPGKAEADGTDSDRDAPADGLDRTFAIYAAACVAIAAAVPWLGFVLPGLLTVFVILRFAEGRSWSASLAYAVALIGAIVLLFGTALNVQFPDGPGERGLRVVRLL
ncbi:hypothetical protein VQ03_06215 [Methylobacterium tarhaniae]|uniref:DUF1468 domain-containing protein n=1 Tax=Methylobacterium tarhaniae TaxID=1187852 RepID=A0A0J6TDD4_9HYPH|nr:tripartite tricarboxylate transporter TctB family protein [Methylobacterium tarhaniae]KMO43877.1 hypothetical protein VQ03_06215 [Methylobacterium tarhaniae]